MIDFCKKVAGFYAIFLLFAKITVIFDAKTYFLCVFARNEANLQVGYAHLRAYMPTSKQYMPTSKRCMPTSSRCMPISSRCMPISKRCMPISSWCMPISSRCMPISGVICPFNEFMPNYLLDIPTTQTLGSRLTKPFKK
jgi:hypothetical protein